LPRKHNYDRDDPFDIDPAFQTRLEAENIAQMAEIDEENDVTMSQLADAIEVEHEAKAALGEDVTVSAETRPDGAVGEQFEWIRGIRLRQKARSEGRTVESGDSVDTGCRKYEQTPTSKKHGGVVTRHKPYVDKRTAQQRKEMGEDG